MTDNLPTPRVCEENDQLAPATAELARKLTQIQGFGATHGLGLSVGGAVVQQMRASQIPIVFSTGSDPVRSGLVASYNRPGGNATGISSLVGEITGKNMGLLHELVPNAKTIALLLDPASTAGVPLRPALSVPVCRPPYCSTLSGTWHCR